MIIFKKNANKNLRSRGTRFAALILVSAMILSTAVACDSGKPSEAETTVTSTQAPETEAPTPTPTPKPTKAPTPTPTEVPDLPGVQPHEALVKNIYTADPSAHVFDGKIYIYGSHDQDKIFPSDNDGGSYQMIDYHVLSMDGFDVDAVDNGVAFGVEDIPWAEKQLWAPDCAYKNGTYYFYFPAKDYDGIFHIGVATSDKPEGPFTPEENYIEGSFSMDPTVFIDDDGQSYMVFGGIWGGQLEYWQTGEYDAKNGAPSGSNPALGPRIAIMSDDMLSFMSEPIEVQILDENGEPLTANQEDKRFFEGAWIHKYNDVYYLSYSTGTTHFLVYATSDDPMGPYTYQGKIMDPVRGWTTHHSILEYEGQWYIFYHDARISGFDSQRNIRYTPLFYNDDGTIQEVEIPK